MLAVGLDGGVGRDRRVPALARAVPAGADDLGLQLVGIEHLADPLAHRRRGLLGDADAGRAASEFDEQVGRFGLLAGALLHAEAGWPRAGVGLLEFEDGVEPSLAVRDGRDPDVVAVLVTEQGVDLPDLL